MARQPLFGGLVVDESDRPAGTAYVGDEPCYVVNDGGLHQAAPTSTVLGMSNGTVSGATTCTAVYGGVTDTSFAVPM